MLASPVENAAASKHALVPPNCNHLTDASPRQEQIKNKMRALARGALGFLKLVTISTTQRK
jgi:hypothetical protein